MTESVGCLTSDQAHYLAKVAEDARVGLSHFVGYEVDYDSTALLLLDEWIDRRLHHSPNPSQATYLLWTSFLGEVFRHRHKGKWIMQERDGKKGGLAVVCPTEDGGLYTVDVSDLVSHRIIHGMSASLSLFYVTTAIELKAG